MSEPSAPAEPGMDAEPAGWPLTRLTPVLLLRAAHPRQAVLTAAGMTVAAAVSGRAAREVGLVAVTVLVGQALLGWDNDLADRRADRVDERHTKPLVSGMLDPGTLAFALACAVLLVVPLSLSSGMNAGVAYLLSLGVGVLSDRLGNRLLRAGVLSWLPWVVAFALYPAYLSYGGWGGAADGHPPTIAMTVAAALLGVGVHILTSLRGLVDDNRAGRRHLPLRLALWLGAPRLMVLASVYCVVVVGLIAVVAGTWGLSQ